MISLFQPRKSWCAKWERYHTNLEELYALNNESEVTSEIWEHLERKERPLLEWVERAKTAQTEAKVTKPAALASTEMPKTQLPHFAIRGSEVIGRLVFEREEVK
jgi:hypothetical protein